MKIALDWDDTWTRDPYFWSAFVKLAIKKDYVVRIVTMRGNHQLDDVRMELANMGLDLEIHATNHEQKREYCAKHEFFPDIWIDDTPEFIV